MPQLWALIVTISQYITWSPAPGAASDGRKVTEFFSTNATTPPARILHLADADATRDGIIASIKKHLMDNEKIERGDPILFYFSGHGTRLKAPIGWTVVEEKRDEEDLAPTSGDMTEKVQTSAGGEQQTSIEDDIAGDDMIEAIVPYDCTAAEDEHPIYPIPDRTLAALINQVASKHGNNITVVLDCCHSGHGMRDDNAITLDGELLTVRALPGRCMPPLPPDLDRDVVPSQQGRRVLKPLSTAVVPDSGDGRALLDQPSPRVSTLYSYGRGGTRSLQAMSGSHVLLAACRPREQAMGGQYGGILTRLWLIAMGPKANIQPRTYSEVMKYINKGLAVFQATANRPWLQNPQCEGIYRDRLLFKETTLQADHFSVVKVENSSRLMTVAAGEVHGVKRGTRFEIFSVNDSLEETSLFEAQAETIYAHTSVARPVSDDRLASGMVYTAAIKHEHQLCYMVRGATQHVFSIQKKLRKALAGTPSIVEATTESEADLALNVAADGTVALQRLDPLLRALEWTPRLTDKDVGTDNLTGILRGVAKFNWLLSLSNLVRPFTENIKLHMLRFKEDEIQDGIFVIPEGSVQSAEVTADGADVDSDHDYALVLENYSQTSLYAQVFFFDPDDYSIQKIYAPLNEAQPNLPRQAKSGSPGRLQIGASTELELTLQYSVTPGLARATLYCLVFLSIETIKLDAWVQGPLLGSESSRSRNMTQSTSRTDPSIRRTNWDIICRPIVVTDSSTHTY